MSDRVRVSAKGERGAAGANGADGAPGTTLHSGLTDVTANQHHAQAHSGTDHTDRITTRSIWLPVDGLSGFIDAAATALATTGSASPDLMTFATLADGATEGAYWKLFIPKDWASGGITAIIHYAPAATDANATHTIRWQTRVAEFVDGTTDYAVAETSAQFTGDAKARTTRVYYKEQAVALGGGYTPSAAGVIGKVAVYRIGANAADTYVGNVRLIGLELQYTSTL